MHKDIILTTINAKWIHPSLALRLLKANLGFLEDRCEIIEFNLRQPLAEKLQPLLDIRFRILGISVSIWNHLATIELLKELEKALQVKPVIVLGGPEISHLPSEAEIFRYADYVIRGEGETAFRLLCEDILLNKNNLFRTGAESPCTKEIIVNKQNNLAEIKTAYYLYTDEDLTKKLIYVEASRGCPFGCEFCLSSIDDSLREFPMKPFLAEMDLLIQRGAKTFKFLDRSFNINMPRAIEIIEFFLRKIEKNPRIVVHFEMILSNFPPELIEALARFPHEALRLEIGIQTLNAEVASRIKLSGGKGRAENALETLAILRRKTNAIIHADLIAGLPGENIKSFGKGFDRLWHALYDTNIFKMRHNRAEIQPGILKLLSGTQIIRHIEKYKMRFNSMPPYEIEANSSLCQEDLSRIKNFARFWDLLVNRGMVLEEELANISEKSSIFWNFMELSDRLFSDFGRNWGIDKAELKKKLRSENL